MISPEPKVILSVYPQGKVPRRSTHRPPFFQGGRWISKSNKKKKKKTGPVISQAWPFFPSSPIPICLWLFFFYPFLLASFSRSFAYKKGGVQNVPGVMCGTQITPVTAKSRMLGPSGGMYVAFRATCTRKDPRTAYQKGV
jgi:hypothetical protein